MRARATQDLSSFQPGLRRADGALGCAVDGAPRGLCACGGQELTITPRHGLREGRKFTYGRALTTACPSALEDGQRLFLATDDGVLVIGEPHVASSWFPVNDHPRRQGVVRLRRDRAGGAAGGRERRAAAPAHSRRVGTSGLVARRGADGVVTSPRRRSGRVRPCTSYREGRLLRFIDAVRPPTCSTRPRRRTRARRFLLSQQAGTRRTSG